MRIVFRKPSQQQLMSLIEKYEQEPITCREPGSTRAWTKTMFETLPNSRVIGNDLWKFRRESLGSGKNDFEQGVEALLQGKCFDLSWVSRVMLRPFEDGDTFSIYVSAFGLWSINFCRIIYVEMEKDESSETVSIGIGTLPQHAAVGEERLSITRDLETDQVDFLIGSYSRPSSFFSWLFSRYLRKRQDLFAIDATERLKRSIRNLNAESGSQ